MQVFCDRQHSYQSRKAWHHLPLFEVALSVQIGCFHVTHSIRVGRVQEQDVSWDDLVREHSHKIPHVDILPSPLHETHLLPARRAQLMPHTQLFWCIVGSRCLSVKCTDTLRRHQYDYEYMNVDSINEWLLAVQGRLLTNYSPLLIPNYMTKIVVSKVIHYITHFR